MNTCKVVIIDDEQLAIDVIKHHLKHFPNFKVMKTFTNSLEALKYLNETAIDIAFTDIAMPHISGTELVRLSKGHTKFVMITSYSEYAIESFELNVIDYILKPVSLERLQKTIERIQDIDISANNEAQNPDSFFIKEGDEFVKVKVKDIDYIEGMKDYSKIVCGNNHYMALKTLKSIEHNLANHQFLRIHKSFIVPLNKIAQYNGKCVLINKHQVPVGNGYRDQLKQFLLRNKL